MNIIFSTTIFLLAVIAFPCQLFCILGTTAVTSKTLRSSLKIEEKKIGFIYENGLDRERIFSGQRRGEIELKEGQILLSTFSKESDEVREELLLNGISKVWFDLKTPSVLRIVVLDQSKLATPFAFIIPPKKEGGGK